MSTPSDLARWRRIRPTVTVVDEPKVRGEGCWHYTMTCYGLCMELLHAFVPDDHGPIRVRHGEGEAVRDFTIAEYGSTSPYLEWIASVHRYEEGR